MNENEEDLKLLEKTLEESGSYNNTGSGSSSSKNVKR